MRGSHGHWSGLCCSMSLCPSCSCWCGVHSVQAAAAACCPSDLRAETGAGVPRRPARPAAASRHGTRILGIRTRRTGGRGRAGEGKVFITVGLHTSDTCHKSGSTSFVLYISTLISIISISPLLIVSSLFCRMHSPSFFAYKPKITSQIWSHI